jgi:hypothetical protein
MKITEVRETDDGLYVWKLPDGKLLGDADGNYMCVEGRIGDIRLMNAMAKAARSYGFPEGKAVFLPGRRKLSKSEWEDHMERMLDGKIPDPYDLGNTPGEV